MTIELSPAYAVRAAESPSGHDILRRSAAAFETGRQLYVDPGAADTVSSATLDTVRAKVNAVTRTRTVFVAVLPAQAKATVADHQDLPEALYDANDQDSGTYVVLCDDRSIYVGSDIIPTERARAIANAARDAGRAAGPDAALLTATQRSTRGGSPGSKEARPYETIAGVIVMLLLSGFGWLSLLKSRRRSRQKRLQALASVRGVAEEDISRLAQELSTPGLTNRTLDLEAQASLDRALTCLQGAKDTLEMARRPQDLRGVSSSIEEARYAMTCLRAQLEGQPTPPWRPPCFFDPTHGPSTEDVPWAPPDGEQRDVPACTTDAEHVRRSDPPETRLVNVDGEARPHWDAGVNYVHWVRGYFSRHADTVKGIWVGTLVEPPDVRGTLTSGHGIGSGGTFGGGGGGFGGGGGRF